MCLLDQSSLIGLVKTMSYRGDTGIFLERLQNFCDLVSRPPVIAVQKRNDVTCTPTTANIQRRYLPPIRFPYQPNTRKVSLHELGGGVGRAVIHDDRLDICCRI